MDDLIIHIDELVFYGDATVDPPVLSRQVSERLVDRLASADRSSELTAGATLTSLTEALADVLRRRA